MSFLPLLFLVFLVLKLTGVIAWGWLAIFAPLIAIPFVFGLLIVIAVVCR